jgi:hypothetical protein
LQGLGDGRGELWDANPSVDTSGWEVSHATNGALRMRGDRERK